MTVAAKRLDEIDADGAMAQIDRKSVDDNPHIPGTDEWWMWRLAYLREAQIEEYESSPARQVDRELEEQSRWEHREKAGINELVDRVCRRAHMLGGLFGLKVVPDFILAMHRKILRDSMEDLLSRTPEARS